MNGLLTVIELLGRIAPILLELPPSEIPFTILPIGDSIAWGYRSPLGNGYRISLSQHLLQAGFPPYFTLLDAPHPCNASAPPQKLHLGHRFVGTQSNGNMLSPYNEGYPGYTIDRIAAVTAPVLAAYCQQTGAPEQQPWRKPNVILLLAGTNDVVANPQQQDTTQAPARLAALLDAITTTCPDAAVLLAQLPGTDDGMEAGVPDGAARVQLFNDAVPGIVLDAQLRGRNVSMVDMGAAVSGADTVDGVHPNAPAYVRMGDVWWEGMQRVLPLLKDKVATVG